MDDVLLLLRERLLRYRATTALEFVDDVAWKFREGGSRKSNDVAIRLVEFAFQVFWELSEYSSNRDGQNQN